MKVRYDYLKDADFLTYVAGLHLKQFYVKITALSWQEDPIRDIEGRGISASFSLDGNSSVRRTGNLSLVTDDQNYITDVNYLLSLNKKVYIQIGYVNVTPYYTNYKMLWFPIGLFLIGSISITNSDTGLTIAVQLKDKISLLNGDCGGTIPASTTLDTIETVNQNGDVIIQRPAIYQIIRELVNHYGGEQLGKIIISDLDTRVKQAIKWNGASNLYLFKNPNADWDERYKLSTDSTIPEGYVLQDYAEFKTGQDIGYIYTDFSFPGDLIAEAGNTIVDVLEKIKSVLGNYEYFYDLDGNFVWQEVKNFFNNSEARYIDDAFMNRTLVPDYISETYKTTESAYLLDASRGKSIFDFNDTTLIKSFTNNPQYNTIKNDYVVWGSKKIGDNQEKPIRYHLVIDNKPQVGNTYTAFEYTDPRDGVNRWHMPIEYSSMNDFPKKGVAGNFYLDKSTQQIYRWDFIKQGEDIVYTYIKIDVTLKEITTSDWRTQLYFQGLRASLLGTDTNYYYTELLNEWPQIYDFEKGEIKEQFIIDPTLLDYYLDFIQPSSKLIDLNVNNIGRRTTVLNAGSDVNCVFEPWIPDIVYIGTEDVLRVDTYLSVDQQKEECKARGQNYCLIPKQIYDETKIVVNGKFYSAYEEIRQQLHQYTQYNESITLQTLPMYHLEPNTRISVRDPDSDIYGDYMINTMSFALDNEGLLTINASRALEKV